MKAEIGTVISGTMRPQDLIPAFLDVLRELNPPTYQQIMIPGAGFSVIPSSVWETKDDPWYDSEEAGWILEDLFDALDACSPENCYFGAHPGDGCDYGFWPCEEE